MRLKIKFLVVAVAGFGALIASGNSVAQDSLEAKAFTDGISVGIHGHYGFILVHRDNMSHLVKGHIPAFELTLEKQTSGLLDNHGVYNFPSVGVSLWHSDLGNKEQLGSGSAIFGFVNFPLVRSGRFLLRYKLGSGVGLISKPFDREYNHKNTAIGSQLNMFLLIQLNAKIQLSDKLGITAGVTFSHYSNGSYKVPNLGINVPTISVGVIYDFGDYQLSAFDKEKKEYDKELDFNVQVGGGAREINPIGGAQYGVFYTTLEGTRRMDRRRKLGVGADVFFDASTMVLYNRNSDNVPSSNQAEFIRYGIHISHELVIGRMSAITQMGVYLYSKYKNDGPLYHRFGYRYQISEHVYADITVKTHWAVAQYVSFGIGYKFN
ncbi:MAG TPA: acyloxyacyl hydrolase [Flavobacteriales bacterium]|nr:acyloxyacyl hydrolase [Flavobacteriales bacterium]